MALPQVGSQIAGYRIERVLEVGGMSIVYLAEHVGLERKVALKVLTPELSADDRFRQRFIRESRLAVSIDHPNVIPVYDAGEVDDVLYIAMLYVQGIDLKDLIMRVGYLDPDRTLHVVSAVASALDAAHARGLVHRDVKPGNILLSSHGGEGGIDHIYLSDFGLTKRAASQTGLTDTGQFAGTVDYVAPEQVEGRDIDGRADVYSLGCVTYECLAGKVPFDKDNQVATLWAHLQDPPPRVSELRADVPAEVDDIIGKAMAKSPADRYAKAGAFAEALRQAFWVKRYSADASIPPAPLTEPGSQRVWPAPQAPTGGGAPVVVPPAPTDGGPAQPSVPPEASAPSPPEAPATRPTGRRPRLAPALAVPLAVLLIAALVAAGFLIGRSTHGTPTVAPGGGTTASPGAGAAAGAPAASTGCTDINDDPVRVGGTLLADSTLTCLLSKHVPAEIRQHCRSLSGTTDVAQLPLAGGAKQPPATDVFLKCSVQFAGNTFDVWYLFKHDRDEVGLDYRAILAANGVAIDENHNSDQCRNGRSIERRWYVAAQDPSSALTTTVHVFDQSAAVTPSRFYPTYGRFTCFNDKHANGWMAWTDANLTVLTVAENPAGGSWDKFESWWRFQAGPGHPPSA